MSRGFVRLPNCLIQRFVMWRLPIALILFPLLLLGVYLVLRRPFCTRILDTAIRRLKVTASMAERKNGICLLTLGIVGIVASLGMSIVTLCIFLIDGRSTRLFDVSLVLSGLSLVLPFTFFQLIFHVLGFKHSSGGYKNLSSTKECGRCRKTVSLSSHAGDRCPHCGAYWSIEHKTYE